MSGESSSPAGKVSLDFGGISDSDVRVTLANGLDRGIYIRGSRTIWLAIQMWSQDTEITCQRPDQPGSGETALFSFADGKSNFIEVSARSRVKLVIPTTFPQKYKGGQCRLSVVLKDGTIVGPVEFRP